jgi:hypothetical protein
MRLARTGARLPSTSLAPLKLDRAPLTLAAWPLHTGLATTDLLMTVGMLVCIDARDAAAPKELHFDALSLWLRR